MKIKIGETYIFTKSGNEVRVIEPSGKSKGVKLWTVERVAGASRGKQMVVTEEALFPTHDKTT